MHEAILTHRQGRLADASRLYQAWLQAEPDNAQALHYYGLLLCQAGHGEQGIELIGRSLAISPDAEAWNNLGAVLLNTGRAEEACACFAEAVKLSPDDAKAHYHLGTALLACHKPREAETALSQAVKLSPENKEAWGNLGLSLQQQGRITQARRALQKALPLGRAWQTLAVVEENAGNIAAALAAHRHAVALLPQDSSAHSALLLAMHCDEKATQQDIYQESLRHPHATPLPAPAPRRAGRIRLGYVSPDFRAHPVGFFLQSVLPHHADFEVTLYTASSYHDAVTDALSQHARLEPIHHLNDDAAAKLIRSQNIDILVDLSGHTGMNRLSLFARRPARVQASWLGYFNTTGLRAMDYVIADNRVIRAGEEKLYTEKVLRLPDYFLCFRPPPGNVEVAPLPALHNGFITFGSMNRLCKLSPSTVEVYARVLHAVPHSRLRLQAKALIDEGVRSDITARFTAHGITPERLSLHPATTMTEMLQAYSQIDIALDPFPHNGGTVTAQSLWCGVPVVTLEGDKWVGRMGESLLNAAGLSELVAKDSEGYVALALQLAADIPALAAKRAGLRKKLLRSALMDAEKFKAALEGLYMGMLKS